MNSASDCDPRIYRKGLWTANWSPSTATPPSTKQFVAHVSVAACGPAGAGGVVRPTIRYSSTRITITFFTKPLPANVMYACPGVPPVNYEIILTSALGDRRLFDGGQYPPAPVNS